MTKIAGPDQGAESTDSKPIPVEPSGHPFGSRPPQDLLKKTAHGAMFSVVGQAISFVLRTASMVIVARLVTPEQFGLVGMVTAFTGFLGLFRDVGLALATVQRPSITREQTSTLFWINLAAGTILALLCLAIAPVLAAFYHEPRLFWVTATFGIGFVFTGAAAQHRALLQRGMRFGVLTAIDVIALLVNIAVGVAMGLYGCGYWTLVAMWIVQPMVGAIGTWIASGWVPGRPHRGTGVRSMLHFGGVVTLNSIVVYVVYNAEKVLLGRFLGAEILGTYGRAYTLISLPTENLNSVVSSVMFPAFSRVQEDPARLRRYFLAGYRLFLAVVIPLTLACALFADDIVLVFLGPQWNGVASIFRLLTPTILAFALINPFGSLMQASGRAIRSLQISFLIGPVVIIGYLIGLRHGSEGVAMGFSIAMLVLIIPVVMWAKHGTLITAGDIARSAMHPLVSSMVSFLAVLALSNQVAALHPPILRLTVSSAVLFSVYGVVLLFGFKQKKAYLDLLQSAGIWKGKRT